MNFDMNDFASAKFRQQSSMVPMNKQNIIIHIE